MKKATLLLLVEKRKYKRYNVTDFIVAMCSNKLGRVVNISENSIAIRLYGEDLTSLPEACTTSLLTVAKGFLIEGLPLKIVRKEGIPNTPIGTVAAKFNTSEVAQLGIIKQYISGLS